MNYRGANDIFAQRTIDTGRSKEDLFWGLTASFFGPLWSVPVWIVLFDVKLPDLAYDAAGYWLLGVVIFSVGGPLMAAYYLSRQLNEWKSLLIALIPPLNFVLLILKFVSFASDKRMPFLVP